MQRPAQLTVVAFKLVSDNVDFYCAPMTETIAGGRVVKYEELSSILLDAGYAGVKVILEIFGEIIVAAVLSKAKK